jgi:two-component sensor histidine kinase
MWFWHRLENLLADPMPKASTASSAPRMVGGLTDPPVTETDALLAEADHRIANNLALVVGLVRIHARHISRGEGPIERSEVKRLLEDVAGRIQAVARLHNLLARAVHRHLLELRHYLPEVCEAVASSIAAEGKVRLSYDIGQDACAPPEVALSLGLIFCELVTNSVKYAHPTGLPVTITIACRTTAEGGLMLDFADDGVGLPEGFDSTGDGGIGFLVVRNRADQLNATYRFETDCLGLRFHLAVPAAQERMSAAE